VLNSVILAQETAYMVYRSSKNMTIEQVTHKTNKKSKP